MNRLMILVDPGHQITVERVQCEGFAVFHLDEKLLTETAEKSFLLAPRDWISGRGMDLVDPKLATGQREGLPRVHPCIVYKNPRGRAVLENRLLERVLDGGQTLVGIRLEVANIAGMIVEPADDSTSRLDPASADDHWTMKDIALPEPVWLLGFEGAKRRFRFGGSLLFPASGRKMTVQDRARVQRLPHGLFRNEETHQLGNGPELVPFLKV